MTMTKPLSPNQVKRPKIGSPEHREHLKKTVTRRLNRELKKGVRRIRVENHIDEELASEIATDYAAQGWSVDAGDHRDTGSKWGWYFTFSVLFDVGEIVTVDMIDRATWPEVFPAKVVNAQKIPRTKLSAPGWRYLIEWDAETGPATIWVTDRYLSKTTA